MQHSMQEVSGLQGKKWKILSKLIQYFGSIEMLKIVQRKVVLKELVERKLKKPK